MKVSHAAVCGKRFSSHIIFERYHTIQVDSVAGGASVKTAQGKQGSRFDNSTFYITTFTINEIKEQRK